ncbi:glycosyltransferase [Clostridium perfringens]|uniref:glycosyltransferase n=1 Tax=Clostridium perfringens TaxID=1502 RepID=UPI0018E4CD53|nr:glycosyltransferase [Clostridium perfringens]MBI6042301.1 glycosyltransferase [Clostridium perfringens]MDH5084131.1 putative glycosyltransferase EpsJ [Clostridium perfringens]MDK0904909.1 glycosyltransferase [Clostridium perfringens]MDM0653555.1 glycosyltransferase [Clostridium perfringens]MDM0966378.1 glycosyltransferase [Clostridium perfringens]
MKLSIIVPVYNVEKYINECIKSLLELTIDNFEIIVVDDGSKDKSISIVKSFNDNRIKIIYKKNGGLSSARNAGLKEAIGEYVAFVDSDDYIGIKDSYRKMYLLAKKNKSDIVSGNAAWYYPNGKFFEMNKEKDIFNKSVMTSEEFFISCMKSKIIYAPVCFNIYKREFLENNNFRFKEGIYHEDEEFTPRVLLKANNVSIYNECFYVYRQRENSIMHLSNGTKKAEDFLEICLSLDQYINQISNSELKFLFKNYLTSIAIQKIYEYKVETLSKEIKIWIKNNSVTKRSKIRSLIIKQNIKLFFFIEKLYRNFIFK